MPDVEFLIELGIGQLLARRQQEFRRPAIVSKHAFEQIHRCPPQAKHSSCIRDVSASYTAMRSLRVRIDIEMQFHVIDG